MKLVTPIHLKARGADPACPRIPRDVVIDSLAFIAPLFIALIAIKVYKVIFALWPLTHTFGWMPPGPFQILKSLAASPLVFTILAVSVGVYCHRLIVRRQFWQVLSLLAIALPAAAFVNAIRLYKGKESVLSLHFLERAGLEFNHWASLLSADLMFVLCYLVLIVAVRVTWHRRAGDLFLYIVNGSLMIAAGLELANYLKTGITDSGPLLPYAVQNASDLLPIIRSEFDSTVALALLAPSTLLATTPLIRLFASKKKKRTTPFASSMVTVSVLAASSLLIIILLVPNRLEQQYHRFSGNIFVETSGALWDGLSRSINVRATPLRTMGGDDVRGVQLKAASDTRRLNVVVIMLESIRARSTGLYNPELDNTPFLNQLSERSLVVDEMYAVIPRTSAAWVGILQGIYPTTNTVMTQWARQEQKGSAYPSMPKLLRSHGYKSAFFVPTHMNYENEWRLISNMHFDHVVSEKDYSTQGFERPTYFGLEDRVMVKPIMTWVDDQASKEIPFLLAVMTNIGHHKYELPSGWVKRAYATGEDENNYLNCIRYIDDFLERLFNEFQQRDLLQSTVFLILGDHGDSFGEHGVRQRAMTLFEEELHVPALIFAPALFPSAGRITGVRQQIDILPTVAEILGLTISGGKLPGSSLLAQAPGERRAFFSTIFDNLSLGMRRGSRKYIYPFGRSPMQVYDLTSDRHERKDIAPTVSPDEIDQAKREMLDWSKRSKALMLSGSAQ